MPHTNWINQLPAISPGDITTLYSRMEQIGNYWAWSNIIMQIVSELNILCWCMKEKNWLSHQNIYLCIAHNAKLVQQPLQARAEYVRGSIILRLFYIFKLIAVFICLVWLFNTVPKNMIFISQINLAVYFYCCAMSRIVGLGLHATCREMLSGAIGKQTLSL